MPPWRARKQRAERFGRFGEWAAEALLRAQFFRIRARRFKTPLGEIDLIATRGSLTIFVEVKTRRSGAGRDMALNAVNRRRISRAAKWYLAHHPAAASGAIRFDVIFLAPFARPYHVKGAFIDWE